MNILKSIYHFLGGIRFAIFLISSAAIFVIIGTFLESLTGSHRYASKFTYESPFFALLIWGFFINILISALRRWPFKARHIPFLITHLGLLMILSGVLVKHYYGVQGAMGLMEGSGSQEIFLADTFSISIENQASKAFLDLKQLPQVKETFADLTIKLINHTPHSSERIESWIKGNKGYISGIKPFEVFELEDPSKIEILPVSAQYEGKKVMAFKTDAIEEVAKKIFLQDLKIRIGNLYEGPLSHPEFLQKGFSWDLQFNYTPLLGFQNPQLIISIIFNGHKEKILIPLDGDEVLNNRNLSTPFLGSLPFEIDLFRNPLLAFIEDSQHDIYFFAFGPNGDVHADSFLSAQPKSLLSYDEGYLGYAAQLTFPLTNKSRKENEITAFTVLEQTLIQAAKEAPQSLSPPLKLLKEACEKENLDFATVCTRYLVSWNKSHQWLYSSDDFSELPCLDWSSICEKELKACYWMTNLSPEIERQLAEGEDLIQLLEKKQWPFISQLQQLRSKKGPCTPDEVGTLLTAFSQQLYQLADQLPSVQNNNPYLFSAYLRLYEIHLQNLLPQVLASKEIVQLECPLTLCHKEEHPLKKLEDNLPKITLYLKQGNLQETKTLTYDRFGKGLKWPVLYGQYLIRFQPQYQQIPYRVRLRDARQINYANSSQPFSFESDLIIKDTRTGHEEEKTISMNQVHETWDGYRFYLASISPPSETAVQQIQIVVNHDPGKYFLTYPGALILSIGMILLFWIYPKKS